MSYCHHSFCLALTVRRLASMNKAFVSEHAEQCRFTLSNGIKFGGHFLAYQGDPYKVHAAFVVRVLPGNGEIAQEALSAACRAAAGAKKCLVLAQSARLGNVVYTTATSVDLLKM
jgi:tRNA splicing endonuclease